MGDNRQRDKILSSRVGRNTLETKSAKHTDACEQHPEIRFKKRWERKQREMPRKRENNKNKRIDEAVRLSVCIITKDEDHKLERCLDSILSLLVEDWCQLVIVDTGSTDRTLDVANKYTALHEHNVLRMRKFEPWSFSDARNYCSSFAIGKRILIIDSDEQLLQDSLYYLKDIVCNPNVEANTIFLNIHNIYSENDKLFTELTQPRIYRNTLKPIYSGAIHNKPDYEQPIYMAYDIIINHFGYKFANDPELMKKKHDRTLPMLLKEYEADKSDIHILTHLVKQYGGGEFADEVVECGEEWVKLMAKQDYHEGWFGYLEVFVILLQVYVNRGDVKNMNRIVGECEKYTDRMTSMYYLMGNCWWGRNDDLSMEYFEKGIDIVSTDQKHYEKIIMSNIRMSTPVVLQCMAVYEFRRGKFIQAGNYLNESVRINDGNKELRCDIFNEESARKRLIPEEIPYEELDECLLSLGKIH